MHAINGIGTTLYGRRYLNKEELKELGFDFGEGIFYIATKWFVFLFFPLIPLASYIVIAEHYEKGFWNNSKQYHLIKINLNWNQVIKTWAIVLIPLLILYLFL